MEVIWAQLKCEWIVRSGTRMPRRSGQTENLNENEYMNRGGANMMSWFYLQLIRNNKSSRQNGTMIEIKLHTLSSSLVLTLDSWAYPHLCNADLNQSEMFWLKMTVRTHSNGAHTTIHLYTNHFTKRRSAPTHELKQKVIQIFIIYTARTEKATKIQQTIQCSIFDDIFCLISWLIFNSGEMR